MSSLVDENFSVLQRLRYQTHAKRAYIFITCGSNLIHAISELLLNLITNSSNQNLTDVKTIKDNENQKVTSKSDLLRR